MKGTIKRKILLKNEISKWKEKADKPRQIPQLFLTMQRRRP